MSKFDEGKFDEQNKPQPVSEEQVQAILAMAPAYANKFYSYVSEGNVRIVFADESTDKKYTVMRSSVVMSIHSFMTMMSMLAPQAQQLQLMMQNQQKADQLKSNDMTPNKESLQ